MGIERRKEALRLYITGLVNYFKLANMKNLLMEIDCWYRRRLRMVIWKQWKRVRTRFQNLVKLGLSKFQAMMFSNTIKGFWRPPQAQSYPLPLLMNRFKRHVTYFSQPIIAWLVAKLRNRRIQNDMYGGVRRRNGN